MMCEDREDRRCAADEEVGDAEEGEEEEEEGGAIFFYMRSFWAWEISDRIPECDTI